MLLFLPCMGMDCCPWNMSFSSLFSPRCSVRVVPSFSIRPLLLLPSSRCLLTILLASSCPPKLSSASLSVHLNATTPSPTRSQCRTLPQWHPLRGRASRTSSGPSLSCRRANTDLLLCCLKSRPPPDSSISSSPQSETSIPPTILNFALLWRYVALLSSPLPLLHSVIHSTPYPSFTRILCLVMLPFFPSCLRHP
jgi:hypothetical protein